MTSRTTRPSRTNRTIQAEERRQHRIKVGVSLFMLFLIVFSTIAYFFTPNTNNFTANGIRFKAQVDGSGIIQGYAATIDGNERVFFTRPESSQTIALPEGFPASLTDATVLVVLFDPADNLTPLYDAFRFQLGRTFQDEVAVVPAVTRPDARYAAFPTFSCEQATPDAPVVLLAQGPLGITADPQNPSCITLSGSQFEYALLHDRIAYRYFGVTED